METDLAQAVERLRAASAEGGPPVAQISTADLRVVLAAYRDLQNEALYSECSSIEAFYYEQRITDLEDRADRPA